MGFNNPSFFSPIPQISLWEAPPEANKIVNPITGDKTSNEAGRALYSIYCVACHGENGKGDGPASLSIKTKPADHSCEKIQKQTDGAIFWKITEGRSNNIMASYRSILTDNERWMLVNYIRTLSEK